MGCGPRSGLAARAALPHQQRLLPGTTAGQLPLCCGLQLSTVLGNHRADNAGNAGNAGDRASAQRLCLSLRLCPTWPAPIQIHCSAGRLCRHPALQRPKPKGAAHQARAMSRCTFAAGMPRGQGAGRNSGFQRRTEAKRSQAAGFQRGRRENNRECRDSK